MNHLIVLGLLLIFTVSSLSSSCPIVSRAGWGARSPTRTQATLRRPVPHVFIHHTAGATCSTSERCKTITKNIQSYHQNTNGWSDIGYSFLIGGDGMIYEGVGWTKVGAHTRGQNSRAIGISFHGDFTKVAPSNAMLQAAKNLIQCGVNRGFISPSYKLHGHRDSSCSKTACPGDALYKIIKTWPHYGGPIQGSC